ncbi:MAG: cation:proton antiporter [Candidatus Omnitrophica bacterium]|nr:cation:proton antiporter [Candidatus Omnitrophota bacterium]
MKKHLFLYLFLFFTLTVLCSPLYAAETGSETNLIGKTHLLVFQLSIILFAAWLGGLCFIKWKLPAVLGEIIAGVIIGPYFLGKIPFLGFEHGLFPLHQAFPISIELYSFATIASIILLFLVGLETDIDAFIQFSLAGSVVGIFGVIVSFLAGDLAGVLLSKYILGIHYGFLDPIPLFLGVISMATSVSISARILSGKRKMNSPEGVTILSSAIIDDVLGIITLAVVLGMAKSGSVRWQEISLITLKAVGIWLFFTLLGLRYAYLLSKWLKKIKNREMITIISFALTLLLAGIFEKSGLAMIIGAYVMGLTLSKTDLSFIIQEKLEMLQKFFVPIFFCVMGMLINLEKMASPDILLFGLIFVVFAILSKLIGCGLPALFLNFNIRGALRIGVGMIPRGEVALIIAGIGLSAGLINDEIFSVALITTFVTILITPPILDKLLDSPKPVLRKEPPVKKELKTIRFAMPNQETAELLLRKVLEVFEGEGFFIHSMGRGSRIFNIRKNRSFITFTYTPQEFIFDCLVQDAAFIHTLFYEVIADVEQYMKHLQSFSETEEIGKKIFEMENGVGGHASKGHNVLSPLAVKTNLKGQTKKEILEELVDLLLQSGQIKYSKKDQVLRDLWEREATMSTGMQDGIALPHSKTLCVDRLTIAVGISQKGVDFASLDKNPAKIFILTLIPQLNPQPYLRTMSEMSRFLIIEKNRDDILTCRTKSELFNLLTRHI